MTISDLKEPPNNRDAERSVLCLEMIDPSGYPIQVAREIAPIEDWYVDTHAMIQRAILAIADREEGVSLLTVTTELEHRGQLADVGGREELNHILTTIYLGPHAAYHAQIIADCAIKRRCLQAAQRMMSRGYDPTEKADGMFADFSAEMNKLAEKLDKKNNRPKTMREHMLEVIDDIERGVEPTKYIGVSDVDRMIGGTAPGEMVVIGGLTSMGKTLLAMQWLHEATEKGETALVISNEMRGKGLSSRLVSKATLMPPDMWDGNATKLRADVERFYASKAPLIVVEHCTTIAEVERVLQRESRDKKIGIVALDYVQLVKGEGQSREQQVGDVSRRFKQCLMRHRLVGLLLSQLNRDSAKQVRMPVLSDLRDSGSIEQDADIVLFPYWEAKQNPNAKPYDYKIIQAKNRPRGVRVPMIEMRVNPVEQWLYPPDSQVDWN